MGIGKTNIFLIKAICYFGLLTFLLLQCRLSKVVWSMYVVCIQENELKNDLRNNTLLVFRFFFIYSGVWVCVWRFSWFNYWCDAKCSWSSPFVKKMNNYYKLSSNISKLILLCGYIDVRSFCLSVCLCFWCALGIFDGEIDFGINRHKLRTYMECVCGPFSLYRFWISSFFPLSIERRKKLL